MLWSCLKLLDRQEFTVENFACPVISATSVRSSAQINGQPRCDNAVLVLLENLQRATPFRGDLRQSQVGRTKGDTQRVHPDEDLGDLFVGHCSLKNVHAVDVVANRTNLLQALLILLVSRVFQVSDASSFEDSTVAHLEDFGDLAPLRLGCETVCLDHEGETACDLREPVHFGPVAAGIF